MITGRRKWGLAASTTAGHGSILECERNRFHEDRISKFVGRAECRLNRHGVRREEVQVLTRPKAVELLEVPCRLYTDRWSDALNSIGNVVRSDSPLVNHSSSEAALGKASPRGRAYRENGRERVD